MDDGQSIKWGVYIHVPFCVSRCNYCDFNTYAGVERYAPAYFRALKREIEGFWNERHNTGVDASVERGADVDMGVDAYAGTCVGSCAGVGVREYADTVFFGGGTPSSVDAAFIADALGAIPRPPIVSCTSGGTFAAATAADGAETYECTLEANPGTLSADKLAIYAKAGVNRLSIGLQSTHESHLRLLGRSHSYRDFLCNYRNAIDAGFRNINADLIFGLPGQTLAEWAETLDAVVSLGIRHLSCYSLSVEDNTPLYFEINSGRLEMPDDEVDRVMYHHAVSFLKSAGIKQYELSNFAEPGRECRHNLKYWTGQRYRGFGAGAHSYHDMTRYSNEPSITGYIDEIESARNADRRARCPHRAAQPPPRTHEEITPAEAEKEFIILRLRLTDGFADAYFAAAFGCGFLEKYAVEVASLTSEGLIAVDDEKRVKLTAKGMDFANLVFMAFI